MVLQFQGKPEDVIELHLSEPCERTQQFTLADLAKRSFEHHTGSYPSESYQFHRLVPRQLSDLSASVSVAFGDQPSFIYLRVTQKNGQMAWSSPVFIEGRD